MGGFLWGGDLPGRAQELDVPCQEALGSGGDGELACCAGSVDTPVQEELPVCVDRHPRSVAGDGQPHGLAGGHPVEEERLELTARYGTQPMAPERWQLMLEAAGLVDVRSELEPWSRPESFWKIRQERDVSGPSGVLTLGERLHTVRRILGRHGVAGALTALGNERVFWRAVRAGKLGYGLFWGHRPASIPSVPRL